MTYISDEEFARQMWEADWNDVGTTFKPEWNKIDEDVRQDYRDTVQFILESEWLYQLLKSHTEHKSILARVKELVSRVRNR